MAFKFSGSNIWKLKVRSGYFENYLGVIYDVQLNGHNYPPMDDGKVWLTGVNISTSEISVKDDGSIILVSEVAGETFTTSISPVAGVTYEVSNNTSEILTKGAGYITSKGEEEIFMDESCYHHFPEINKQQDIITTIRNAINNNYRQKATK
ncbi:TPA: hypothetical protein PFE07_004604 [Kluyvera cryocrescens]|nr:hypothetical protein [Kluyvera cryocrescens]